MFTYPVHQAADILFCHANLVPVGKDQLPHVEGTRTIARRFNERYAAGEPYFPLPDALLTDAPLLLGVDGRKMSKSRHNAIALAASEDETARLIRGARTDAERLISYQPERRPEVANLVRIAALSLDQPPAEVAARVGRWWRGGAQAAGHRGAERAAPADPRPAPRVRRRPRLPAPGAGRWQRTGPRHRRPHPVRRPVPHAHHVLNGRPGAGQGRLVSPGAGGWAGRFPAPSRPGGG